MILPTNFSLTEMKCLDVNDELTPLGRILARLPIEPRLGRMMILSTMMQLGDPLSTIAANSTTFPEIFIAGLYPIFAPWTIVSKISSNENFFLRFAERRLTFAQKAFSGNRYSDHIAMLNAFQTWCRVARRGPEAEESFCEQKQISIPTMKVTFEAKVSSIVD